MRAVQQVIRRRNFRQGIQIFQLQRYLLAIFYGGFCCAAISTSDLAAHEFEDGYIDRSIDVILRDQDLQIKYAIGLSDETIVEWLQRENAIDEMSAARFREQIRLFESTFEKTRRRNGTDSAERKADLPPREPLEFQNELSSLLNKHLAADIVSNLSLTIDGDPVGLDVQESAPSPRHHVRLELLLRARIPERAKTKLEFSDGNFLQQVPGERKLPERPGEVGSNGRVGVDSGAVSEPERPFRYTGSIRKAIRVKGDAILLRSNSVPVLTRAKPINLGSENVTQRTEAATITSIIAFAGPRRR